MLLEDSTIDPKVCQEAGVGEALIQYIRESHVYVIIWKPLVDECLQYVKKSTNKVEKNTVAVVCTNSHYKKRDGWPCATEYLHDCIHFSIPSPLRFGHICKRETCQPWR